MKQLTFAILVSLAATRVFAGEVVNVKYRGPVPLDTFQCYPITDSTFIRRVCYDAKQSYMLISLKGTWYHYCEIGADVVQGLLAAPEKGKVYNSYVKGNGNDGPYDCRTHAMPYY